MPAIIVWDIIEKKKSKKKQDGHHQTRIAPSLSSSSSQLPQQIQQQILVDLPASGIKIPTDFKPLFLTARNPHPLDNTIRFLESPHTYYVQWFLGKHDKYSCTFTLSVSGVIALYHSKFDPDATITKMIHGRNWRSSRYYSMDPKEIKQMWAKSGEEARDTGTRVHYVLECFYNGLDITPYKRFKVIRMFMEWHNAVILKEGWQPFRTEMRLRTDARTRLTGTSDMLFIPADQLPPEECGGVLRIWIVDWKISKKIKKEAQYAYGRKMYGVCQDLDDDARSHYTLQQNVYKYVLQNFYGPGATFKGKRYSSIKVVGMTLVVLHDSNEYTITVPLPDITHIVEAIFEERAKVVAAWEQKCQAEDLLAGEAVARLVAEDEMKTIQAMS